MPADLPLHPDVRSLYGGSLRPPPGTVFDAGVATTFTLDIETALAVPVTLALFASEDRDELLKSPLALLEGLERTADRLAIFCEAGRIQAQPAPQSRLCTLLERLITEVAAPRGGSFHPKLWVLRYRPLETGEPTRIRLLVCGFRSNPITESGASRSLIPIQPDAADSGGSRSPIPVPSRSPFGDDRNRPRRPK